MSTATEVERPTKMIPLSDINANAYNVRGKINPQECVDLAVRIKKEGLNNPIEVVPVPPEDRASNDGKPYRLFAGFRRFMAHRINGATHIECKIYEGLSLAEEAERNFTENLARKDLDFMQEARGIERLRSLRGGTLVELGEHIGKSPKWVQQRIWAMEMEPEVQKAIEEGWLKTSHIDEIHALKTSAERFDYVKQVKRATLSGQKPRKSYAKKNVFAKKMRGRADVFEMQDHILDQFGPSWAELPDSVKPLIQILGWAAGEATDMEVFETLRKLAKEAGRTYEIPESAMQALQG